MKYRTGTSRGFLLEYETADRDECAGEDNGGCSHECTNTEGGRECSCPPHMVLSQRGDTCLGEQQEVGNSGP